MRSVLGLPSCLPDVSCEYCHMWLVSACVYVELAFTGIRSWYFQHFGFGRIAQNFLKGASRGCGRQGLDGAGRRKKGLIFVIKALFSVS